MEYDRRMKTMLKYLLNSVVVNTDLMEVEEEDKEVLINEVFNMLVNALKPEYALMFLDVIGVTAKEVHKYELAETLDEITKAMKEG